MTLSAYNFDWSNPAAMQSKFDDLVREKEFREKRRLTLRVIAQESGLSLATVARIKNGDLSTLRFGTIMALAKYFRLRSIADLADLDDADIANHEALRGREA